MEREVYVVPEVEELYNKMFISVKMQMDTSKMDDESVKRKYGDAHFVKERYKPKAYPTFIFLTPAGELANIYTGARDVDGFIELAKDVTDPKKNYTQLLEHYKKGDRNLREMSYLALTGLSVGDTAMSQDIARQYILTLQGADLLTKDNVDFMRVFTKSSNDPGFTFFYRHADTIDQIMSDDNYAQQAVQMIIFKELVEPAMISDSAMASGPDWQSLSAVIEGKYNAYYAGRVITAAKSTWGLKRKNWAVYTRYLVKFFETYGPKEEPMLDLTLNNYAWAVFLHSNDTLELRTALSWSGKAILLNPASNWIDTYANILYKLGDKDRALQWEAVALKVSPTDTSIQANVKSMSASQPTWPPQ